MYIYIYIYTHIYIYVHKEYNNDTYGVLSKPNNFFGIKPAKFAESSRDTPQKRQFFVAIKIRLRVKTQKISGKTNIIDHNRPTMDD